MIHSSLCQKLTFHVWQCIKSGKGHYSANTVFAWISVMDLSPHFASADYGTAVTRVCPKTLALLFCSPWGRWINTLLSIDVHDCDLTNITMMSLVQIWCLKIRELCYWLFTTGFQFLLHCIKNTHQLYFTASQPAHIYIAKGDSWGDIHDCVLPTYLQAPQWGAKLEGESFELSS